MTITRTMYEKYLSIDDETALQAYAVELGYEIWMDMADDMLDAAEDNGWPMP